MNMALDGAQLAAFIVTLGAVAMAAGAIGWVYYLSRQARSANSGWRSWAEKLELAVDRADALLSAHPGVLFAWEEDATGGISGWGAPAMYGAPASIASLLRFAEAADGSAPLEARILDGMADYDATDAAGHQTTLRKALARLGADGAPFSLVIHGPGGRALEVDGRPAASRIALWVADPNLKASEYLSNAGKTEEAGRRIFDDPEAFEDVLKRLPLPAWRYSSGGKLVWANPSFLHVVEAKDLRDAQSRDLHLDDRTREQSQRSIHDGVVSEQRVITAVGAQRLVEVLTYPISGGIAGIAVDLTPLANARDGAQTMAEVRASALNRVDDAVAIFSPDRELVFFNTAFVRLFGLDPAWLKKKPTHGDLLDKLHQDGRTPTTADYGSWRAEEMVLYAREDRAVPDGLWELDDDVRLRVVRLRHPAGGGVVVFRDETELHRLQVSLNTKVSVQRETLDKLSDAIAVFGSDARCQLQNAAFAKLWDLPEALTKPGVPFDDIMDACLPIFSDRKVWAQMKARVTNITNPEVRREAELEITCAGDRKFHFVSRPLADGATALGFTDVTDQRRVATMLRERANLLEDTQRMQNDFVSHVSTKLRDPLQTILVRPALMRMALNPDESPKQIEDLMGIEKAAEQLNRMVDNILDIAAIRSNMVDFDLETMDIRPALDDALQLAQTSAEHAAVRVNLSCPFDIGAMQADPRRFKQVVYNLLSNAMRHTPEGKSVELGAERTEDGIKVWVQDEGEGIPAEQQAEIFTEFKAGAGGGAGLGLSLVRAFMDLHGGFFGVESEPNAGTRVTCYFPAKPDQDTDQHGDGAQTAAPATPSNVPPLRTAMRADNGENTAPKTSPDTAPDLTQDDAPDTGNQDGNANSLPDAALRRLRVISD